MSKKRILIGYSPFLAVGNEYTENMKEILSEIGDVVPPPNINFLFKFKRRCDVIVVNWAENDFIKKSSGGISFIGIFKAFFRVFFYRAFSRNVVFVRHNFFPHSTGPRYKWLAKIMTNFYSNLFDSCWVHSGHIGGRKTFYIPHPSYKLVDDYLASDFFQQLPGRYFLVFGNILPYKRIESIIQVLPETEGLVVCGRATEQDYIDKIFELANGRNNIKVFPRYFDASEASALIKGAQAVIVNNADEDMIVSGSIIHALSFGARVLAKESGFVTWIKSKFDGNLIVSYKSEAELPELVKNFCNKSDDGGVCAEFSHDNVRLYILKAFYSMGIEA